ncbi:MAG: TraB/GumN family protein [Methanomicrobia archaeon]|nr:TraB/GumN family protein [Methanomicrobia archaeon]
MSVHTVGEIIMVGTGHVLEKSVKEVEAVIERERPDVVAVELCDARYKSLKGDVKEVSPKEMLSAGNPFLILTHWLLAYVQRKMGSELGIEPGADMMAAIRKAEEQGAAIALIDRPIQITMQRFWKKMRLWEKLKMLFSIIFSIASIGEESEGEGTGGEQEHAGQGQEPKRFMTGFLGTKDAIELDRLTDEDVVTQLMNELREFSPGAATALLDERDAYIARSLLDLRDRRIENVVETGTYQPSETWDQTAARGGPRIVAVVGAGHVAGIMQYLDHPESIPTKELLCSVHKKRFGLSLKHLLTAGIGVAFLLILLALLFTGLSFDVLLRAFLWWFFINGVLSAVGVVLARGHPFSALTAFAVAWLTSLNPFLAAGWFAGLAEAHVRKPSLDDVKTMLYVESLGELLSNRLFKVILVAALANLGSIAGTFIGAYVVWQQLGIDVQDIWIGLESAFGTLL